MGIAVFGRPNPDGEPVLWNLLSSSDWRCEEVPRTDSELPMGASVLIVSSAMSMERPGSLDTGASTTIHMDWSNTVKEFRDRHPNLPIVILTGGRLPKSLMELRLAACLQAKVAIIEIEDDLDSLKALGQPSAFLHLKATDLEDRAKQDLILKVFNQHAGL